METPAGKENRAFLVAGSNPRFGSQTQARSYYLAEGFELFQFRCSLCSTVEDIATFPGVIRVGDGSKQPVICPKCGNHINNIVYPLPDL